MDEFIICDSGEIKPGSVPEEVKILPMGLVHSQKGNFTVDDESFELIVSAFKERAIDIVIDYEHQTLADVQAPAGGWIKDIIKVDGAIVAKVEWTEKAAEYLKNKEYKYLSPVVLVRKSDNKAKQIHSVALTNTPAIDGMYAIVNSNKIDTMKQVEGGNKMDLKKLIEVLGLDESATEEQILQAIAALTSTSEKDSDTKADDKATEMVANSIVLGLLGLNKDAKTEDVAASILALKAGGADEKVEELSKKIAKKEADEAVIIALKDGKITAAQKEWATEYALKDPTGFAGFLEKATRAVPISKTDLIDAPKSADVEVDMKALKNMGLSDEDIKKYITKGENA